ncbi:MAG: phosphatidylserine decarboxylase [bacterium]|nr:phosphatidylserine decarboxylase [bacterium]
MIFSTFSGTCAHTLAQLQRPRWLVRLLIRGFAWFYHINMGEAAQPLDQYASLMQFFTRTLKPGARLCDPDPAAIVAPVDGRIVACGYARDGELVLVKGHPATLADVFGPLDDAFRGGAFIGIYLSPADCHRLYTPCAGRVVRTWRMGAALHPVYPAALQRRPDTPIRNQRIITELAHPHGRVLFAAALNSARWCCCCLRAMPSRCAPTWQAARRSKSASASVSGVSTALSGRIGENDELQQSWCKTECQGSA